MIGTDLENLFEAGMEWIQGDWSDQDACFQYRAAHSSSRIAISRISSQSPSAQLAFRFLPSMVNPLQRYHQQDRQVAYDGNKDLQFLV